MHARESQSTREGEGKKDQRLTAPLGERACSADSRSPRNWSATACVVTSDRGGPPAEAELALAVDPGPILGSKKDGAGRAAASGAIVCVGCVLGCAVSGDNDRDTSRGPAVPAMGCPGLCAGAYDDQDTIHASTFKYAGVSCAHKRHAATTHHLPCQVRRQRGSRLTLHIRRCTGQLHPQRIGHLCNTRYMKN